MLIHDFLQLYARNTPDAACVTDAGHCYSYADIDRLSNRLANGLRELGIERGQRLAILGENSVEHAVALMACSKTGVVHVPLNYRLTAEELAFVIADAKTRLLIVLAGLEGTLEQLRGQLPDDMTVVTARPTDSPQNSRYDSLSWADWLDGLAATTPAVERREHDACTQLYTSGTTGAPKGVICSHYNLVTLTLLNAVNTRQRADTGSVGIICAPMFHIAGLGSVVAGICWGQHSLFHRSFDPQRLLDDIEQHPVSSLFLVPAMIMAMLAVPGVERRDFSGLQQIFYGASAISESVLRRAMEVFQCDFSQMYGMTETTGTVVCLSPDDHRRALAGELHLLRSCGRPSAGVSVAIVGAEGQKLPAGEVGEVWLRSPTNMLGYYNLPAATAESLTDGWVHTGDAGYVDAEGYLYLKDRIKDMVVSGAENIYPVEVENAIAKHPAVADVAVIGVPDERYGEALLACVVTRQGMKLDIEEMVVFCRGHIAGYKIPRQLRLIDELPRNPSGKILKRLLREPYWASAATPQGNADSAQREGGLQRP